MSRRAPWLSTGRLLVAFALLSLVPLALLAFYTARLGADAVEKEVRGKLDSTASLSAVVVQAELDGLTRLVSSYADRPSLAAALADGDGSKSARLAIAQHLRQLRETRPGVYTAFLARPDGRLIDIVPATPAIVGRDFSFRDWYGGVLARRGPYVSEAYRTQAVGEPLVVAAADLVRAPAESPRSGQILGILVAAYDLRHIQEHAANIARAQGVKLRVTDQQGVLVASGEDPIATLVSRRGDPRVRAALSGRAGIAELDTPDGRRLSAYAPVPGFGWTVTASVPAGTALAAIGDLRSAVLAAAAILALVLVAALAALLWSFRARRRAEEEAHRLADINRAVLDATADAIAMMDRDGNLVVTNSALERMARDVFELPLDRPVWELTAAIAERTTDPEAYRSSIEAIRQDPELVSLHEYELEPGTWIERYTAPVRSSDQQPLGRIFVLRDITARREAERLKAELVATVSHELRTPLASILGFSELLVTRDLDDGARTRYLGTIHSEARRLTELINDFLDLQRMELGKFTVSLEPFELGGLLRETVATYSGQSAAHSLELELLEGALDVAGERDRIRQVVGNLISNAVKYSPGGGSVLVRAETVHGAVRVSIQDSGLGIPAAQQRRIFTKFFRVDSSDIRQIGGTGLGLALCREIVEAHGGRIGFESVEGEGSTFWFELPARRLPSADGRPTVLVIEDDPAAAVLLSEYLSEDGFAVDVAATGEEGLARAAEQRPALVCLDIALPGELDGWDVLARLKDSPATADIPVLVCTALNGRERAATLGAADFLTKPFPAERLRQAVARVMPAGGRSVLVVDDEEPIRRLVVETLSGDGFEFREAADGAEALAHVAARRPDAIVLDLVMPHVDGFEVLERLQADRETRAIPVVVLTAKRLSRSEREELRARAVSLMEKSAYSGQELRELVLRALGRSPGAEDA